MIDFFWLAISRHPPLINWPLDLEPVNPEKVIGLAQRDADALHYLHRNAFSDENDILFQLLINRHWMRGYIDTPDNGLISIYGLGERVMFPTGFKEKSRREGPYEETHYESFADGGGVITLKRVDTLHGIAIDYDKATGAAGVIAFAHPWFDRRGRGSTKQVEGKRLRYHEITVAGTDWLFFTLSDGEHPLPVAEGDAVRIGQRLYRFDGKKIVSATRP